MLDTPAKAFALLGGATLVLAGVLGFFYNAEFTTDADDRDAVLGILDVNGFHNLVHIGSGALGLVMGRTRAGARTFALLFAVVYAVVVIGGFIVGDGGMLLSIVPINTEDNILHVVLALTALFAYATSAPAPGGSAAAPA